MQLLVSSGKRTLAVCFALLMIPLAVVVGQNVPLSGSPSIEVVIGPDPISTRELSGFGGATLKEQSLDEIASRSDLLVRARVVDVRQSRLNTPDGTLRTAAMLEDRDQRRPVPITNVEIEFLEVIGAANDARSVDVGDKADLTIFGGIVDYRINDADLVKDLGIMEVVGANPRKEQHPDPVDGKPILPPDGEEVERLAEVPVVVSIGLSPSEELTEGDEVTLFLSEDSLRVPGGGGSKILTPAHPYGILYPDEATGELRDQRGVKVTRNRVRELGNSLSG